MVYIKLYGLIWKYLEILTSIDKHLTYLYDPTYKGRKEASVLVFGDILDADQVGEMLKIHPRTVKRLASQGELPGFKVGGQWRFRREAIEEYVRRQEHRHDTPEQGN